MAEETAGSVLGERYELSSRIGEGAMGRVWRARDRRAARGDEHQDVAVKLMLADVRESRSLRERFEREGACALTIRHPNVVSVLDHGVAASGSPYLVLELLRGEPLEALLEREPTPPIAEVVRIVACALEGLEAVHAAGVVHRDLKPDNIYLEVQEAGPPVPRIVDFGVARVAASGPELWDSLTRSGEMLGTPLYMSPEQSSSAKHVDERTDVYAMGVVLYVALAGKPPFDGESLGALLIQAATQEPRPVHEVRPEVGEALSQVCMRAIRKTPEERFASARAMREALLEAARTMSPARRAARGPARARARRPRRASPRPHRGRASHPPSRLPRGSASSCSA